MQDMVLVLNFDDNASRALARKLRSERIMCRLVPGDTALEDIQAQEPLGLLLAGGATGRSPSGMDARLPSCGLPILALGDAAGMLLAALGGAVGDPLLQGAVIGVQYQDSPLFAEVENGERLLQNVREFTLPEQTAPLCFAQEIVLGFAHRELPLYGIQFGLEQNDPEGGAILRNFALSVCGCTPWWDYAAFCSRAEEEIKRRTGTGRAVCAMTGGLDSGVSALLAYRALGPNLKCIFVDTGLLREREAEDFLAYYRDTAGLNIIRVSARGRFLDALRGVTDPNEKRGIIGGLIQKILREQAADLGPFDVLVRGTSCSDAMAGGVITKTTLGANVQAVEPVRDLFKDEIRQAADYLGIPQDIISRQPFPGSGLAMRIMGEVTEERLKTLRAADAIFRDEVQRSAVSKRLWQYFAVLCPMIGDESKSVICLRAVHASERSQAYAARLPYDVMESAVDAILRDQKNVCRVVYDLTPSANYAGIEWQ